MVQSMILGNIEQALLKHKVGPFSGHTPLNRPVTCPSSIYQTSGKILIAFDRKNDSTSGLVYVMSLDRDW